MNHTGSILPCVEYIRTTGTCTGKSMLGSNGKDCGTSNMRLHVGDYNDASQCAQGVKDMPECSSTFFYAPAKGWCQCQAAAGECSLIDSANYNQYRTAPGISYLTTIQLLFFVLFPSSSLLSSACTLCFWLSSSPRPPVSRSSFLVSSIGQPDCTLRHALYRRYEQRREVASCIGKGETHH